MNNNGLDGEVVDTRLKKEKELCFFVELRLDAGVEVRSRRRSRPLTTPRGCLTSSTTPFRNATWRHVLGVYEESKHHIKSKWRGDEDAAISRYQASVPPYSTEAVSLLQISLSALHEINASNRNSELFAKMGHTYILLFRGRQ